MHKFTGFIIALGLLAGCVTENATSPGTPVGEKAPDVGVTLPAKPVSVAPPAPKPAPKPAAKPKPEPKPAPKPVPPAPAPAPAPAPKTASGDWPTWGGNGSRNMVNLTEKNIPATWDAEKGTNIKWSAKLGSQSYGNPVVSNGKIYVGTNNEGLRDPELKGDKGVVMCFNEADGKFLWQAVFDKLAAGRVNDWPLQGICSTPAVEGDRVYFVNNQCQIVCVDTEGFYDGENDGMQDEQYTGEQKADIVWVYDMIEDLGVFPHNLATCSPLIAGDQIVVVTGNGVDEGHLNIPTPDAPSFLAVDKKTGEYKWDYADLKTILHGQWSSAAVGTVNGQQQLIFPGGDGWVYSLSTEGKLIWKFDCNPKASLWELGGYGSRNNLIATPVIVDNSVFIGVGQDPEHGTGVGHFYRIDASGKGDVTATAAKWHIGGKEFGRTMSTAAVKDGLVYISDLGGYLNCLDAETGKNVWKHDLLSTVWGSSMVADGKIYIGDEDGTVTILEEGRSGKVLGTVEMPNTVYTTPTMANGVMFIATRDTLYAIAK